MKFIKWLILLIGCLIFASAATAQTVALWLFDEQVGLYPSCVLSDAGPDDMPLILGPGGQMVPGMFTQPPLKRVPTP